MEDVHISSMPLVRYLQNLSTGRTILWCYFIWWAMSIIHHFDATPRIWLTSLGLSGIIGAALILSTRPSSGAAARMDPWVIFRLFFDALLCLQFCSFGQRCRLHSGVSALMARECHWDRYNRGIPYDRESCESSLWIAISATLNIHAHGGKDAAVEWCCSAAQASCLPLPRSVASALSR
jgi:hypothetical protein